MVKEWHEAGKIEDKDECDVELTKALAEQIVKTKISMFDAMRLMHDYDDYDVIVACWEAIRELSNLIRCYSAIEEVNGELFGLKVLLDALEDDYE